MKQRVRDLLQASPFQPFLIRTADGNEYPVTHPEFVLAAPDTPNIVVEERDGRIHFLSALFVTGVTVQPRQAA